MSEMGVCVECETKLNDKTVKPISICPLCNRPICQTHSRSKLTYIPDFKHTGKALKEVYKIVRADYVDAAGHPCLPYTLNFWKAYDLEKERKRQRIKNQMDGFGYCTDEEIDRFKAANQIVTERPIEIPAVDTKREDITPSLWVRIRRFFNRLVS